MLTCYNPHMHTIAVVSEKGGVGKTTLSLDLAVNAVRSGMCAAVLDIDPQSTASKWTDRRHGDTPWVLSTHAARLGVAIAAAGKQGVDLVVIDTPPHSSGDAVDAARLADLVILPLEPHMYALETITKAGDLLRLAGNPPAFFVVNKAPIQGSEAAAAIDYITGHGFEVAPVTLHFRAAHRHAGNVGKVAAEFDATGKAAAETSELYDFISTQLRRSKNNGKG